MPLSWGEVLAPLPGQVSLGAVRQFFAVHHHQLDGIPACDPTSTAVNSIASPVLSSFPSQCCPRPTPSSHLQRCPTQNVISQASTLGCYPSVTAWLALRPTSHDTHQCPLTCVALPPPDGTHRCPGRLRRVAATSHRRHHQMAPISTVIHSATPLVFHASLHLQRCPTQMSSRRLPRWAATLR